MVALPLFFVRQWNAALIVAAAPLLVPIGSVLLGLSDLSPLLRDVVSSTYSWVWPLVLAAQDWRVHLVAPGATSAAGTSEVRKPPRTADA